MKISREKYLKALDIVERYHSILEEYIEIAKFNKIEMLQTGDFVKCISTRYTLATALTLGKEYKIQKFSKMKDMFWIKDDDNKIRKYQSRFRGIFKPVVFIIK